MNPESSITPLLKKALAARSSLFDAQHESAFRLLNGFTEGHPRLAVDLYAATLLLHNYADPPEQGRTSVNEAIDFYRHSLPWLRAGMVKTRHGGSQAETRGVLAFGDRPDERVRENGLWHAVDLQMNRDASLYLDTRELRRWLVEHVKGRSVLNAFAYTGSFGTAAAAGGAGRVVQLDLNRKFLDLARKSYALNGFPVDERDFIAADFFTQLGIFKKAGELFDCVLIDPPFFSSTSKGRIDQVNESARLINKVRPLVRDGGQLIAINNALYVSGRDYLRTLDALCADGYLKIRELIPVPVDFTGFPGTRGQAFITDPAPFNHATKIAVLDVRRKPVGTTEG
jgi:23S rRNA (cytosine1962-C5)-methyltransferase